MLLLVTLFANELFAFAQHIMTLINRDTDTISHNHLNYCNNCGDCYISDAGNIAKDLNVPMIIHPKSKSKQPEMMIHYDSCSRKHVYFH